MARKTEELSPLEVGRLTSPGYHYIGSVAGLVLQITERGTRSWLLRVTVGGKRREIGLGGYPDVTLAGAKESARVIREKIKAGIDPVAERIAAQNALIAARASAITFSEAAKKYIAANESGWKSTKHAAQWTATLEAYAYPTIGKLPVSAIGTSHVVNIIEPIWATKTETASRLRGRIESVLDWAKVRGYRSGENPARWKGHLDHILPPRKKVQKVEHYPALPYSEICSFIEALKKVDGTGARALEFAILTASRSGEVRGATWAEINEVDNLWVIPSERMKAGREHHIPLTESALTILKNQPRIAGTDLIFPSSRNSTLSDMTLTSAIRRMDESSVKAGGKGWKDHDGQTVTAHGFRSTFRDWAGETTAHPREVTEHALAHGLKDKVEAAYQRGTMLEKRRLLMADWGKYCTTRPDSSTPSVSEGAA
jgi:integrase